MIEDSDNARAEMLILSALTYRGFSDLLSGEIHEGIVRQQVAEGLERLPLVSGQWDLVWGPVTAGQRDRFDSNALFVVKSRSVSARYVVAVRGTNPLSLTDWLFGDFVVSPTVAWPFADDGCAISTSTAFGLRTILGLEWVPSGITRQIGETVSSVIRDATHAATVAAEESVRALGGHRDLLFRSVLAQFEQQLMRVISDIAAAEDLPRRVEERLNSAVKVQPAELRPVIRPVADRRDGQTLVEFFAAETDKRHGPIEVVVTGHSKGGALAPVLALCLKATRTSQAGEPGWDGSGQSMIGCVTFAGPTPGNGAFARRVDRELGSAHQRIANTNDVVTHAWGMRQLQQIAFLFEQRSAPLQRLLAAVAAATSSFDYQHASAGFLGFAGPTESARSFVEELVHQHLDAYLDRFGLRAHGIDALTLFVG
jgi:hypothetical protein